MCYINNKEYEDLPVHVYAVDNIYQMEKFTHPVGFYHALINTNHLRPGRHDTYNIDNKNGFNIIIKSFQQDKQLKIKDQHLKWFDCSLITRQIKEDRLMDD